MSTKAAWRKALEEFAAEVRGIYGPRLAKVVLYGSRARGDAEEDADIDVLVVLKSMESTWDELRRLEAPAHRASLAHDVVLTPLPVTSADLADNPRSLFVNVRREGIAVA